MTISRSLLLAWFVVISSGLGQAENVKVDVNLNMKHSVGGISDFGRQRHITLHSSLSEPDWHGEEEKMDYLMNRLDVHFGRDNGLASWIFRATKQDPERPSHPDLKEMEAFGTWQKGQYEKLDPKLLQYEARSSEMIMGTNPHPTYPTLCYWDDCWCGDEKKGGKWYPGKIETSAEWVTQYLDKFFAKEAVESGQPLPKYWEVINEPDMILNTGGFMFSSWEDIWEYHNLVAKGVRQRLGDKAPLIGGMTWGLHDLFSRDHPRFDQHGYTDRFYGNSEADEVAKAYARQQTKSAYWGMGRNEWFQWDVIWRGFIDAAGANMDFYSVHFYDWPRWETSAGQTIRAGGGVEATLELLEWYQLHKYGKSKPIVVSEYGAIMDRNKRSTDPKYRDWANLRAFSQMMLQFLERPDLVVKTMPFVPVKAQWGDYVRDGVLYRYPSTMLNKDEHGVWQWRETIKWYELWSDVKGTRIDTRATDLDIQVDAYVHGNHVYLILNSLEQQNATLDLALFGANGNKVGGVHQKYLHLDTSLGSQGQPALSDVTFVKVPESVILAAGATMILDIQYQEPVSINETSQEHKYYGEPLTEKEPYRAKTNYSALTAHVNNVTVPAQGEAMLRLTGKFHYDHVTAKDERVKVTVNDKQITVNPDWRGESPGRPQFFAVLEVPVPLQYLQANNRISATFMNQCEYSNISLQVWDMSIAPGRSTGDQSTADAAVE